MSKYYLSDIADFISDKIEFSSIELDKYISTDNMLPNFNGVTLSTVEPSLNKCTKFKAGDTLFSNIRTYFKKVWFADFDGGCSPDVIVMRTKNEEFVLHEFLYLLICSEDFINFTVMSSNGAKMPRGDKKAMLKYEFEIPSIEEQKIAINHYFKIKEKIQLNTQINQTLEQIAQALFKSWFVDFDPVHAKVQALSDGMSLEQAELAAMQAISGKTAEELTALSQTQPDRYAELAETAKAFPCEMVEVDGVEVPKGWEIKPIELILDRLKNKQKLRKEEISFERTIPVFEQGASILMGYHDKDAAFNASIDEPIFIFGDHTCITKLSTIPFSIYQNVIPLIGKNLPTYWVYCAIQNKQTFQEYRRHWAELIVKEVVVPDNINLCQCFSKKVKELFFKIDINHQENKNLIKTRDLLLPKLLNGEIE